MPAPGLEHCPRCGYDLRGLPGNHRCPECGFEYDEQTWIRRPKHPRSAYVPLVLAGVWSVAQTFRLVRSIVGGDPLLTPFTVVGSLALPVIIALTFKLRSTNRRGRFIAVTPFGIVVRTAQREESIPWHAIRSVAPAGRVVLIRWRDDSGAFQLEHSFDNNLEANAFRTAFERALQRYGHAPRMVTPTRIPRSRKKPQT
jgi:hypothetical protein